MDLQPPIDVHTQAELDNSVTLALDVASTADSIIAGTLYEDQSQEEKQESVSNIKSHLEAMKAQTWFSNHCTAAQLQTINNTISSAATFLS